jgi:hypothetical protein
MINTVENTPDSDKKCVCENTKEINCSEKDTGTELIFSNIEKKLQLLPGFNSRRTHDSERLCGLDTLGDIRNRQDSFLKNSNIDHTCVCLYLKGIYDRQNTTKFHDIQERSKYSVCTEHSHGCVYTCPFCEEAHTYIEQLVHYNNFKTLINNINGKSIKMTFIEHHMIIYHNFIPDRVFCILFEVLDIDDIFPYVEPEYEFLNKWTFGGNYYLDFSVKDLLFNEYLSKVTFKKIVFENGCMGYIVPTEYNQYTFVKHYNHLLKDIKIKNNIFDAVDMDHLYRNNRNIRLQIDFLFSKQNWYTLSKFTFDSELSEAFDKTKSKYICSVDSNFFDISKFHEQMRNDFEILNEKNYMDNVYSKNLIIIVILHDRQSKWQNDLRIKNSEMRSKYENFDEFAIKTEKFEIFTSTVDDIVFYMSSIIVGIDDCIIIRNIEHKLIKL